MLWFVTTVLIFQKKIPPHRGRDLYAFIGSLHSHPALSVKKEIKKIAGKIAAHCDHD
jgi:hypothetical protein